MLFLTLKILPGIGRLLILTKGSLKQTKRDPKKFIQKRELVFTSSLNLFSFI